jgi:aminoglycoside N3'-acetyltransferase
MTDAATIADHPPLVQSLHCIGYRSGTVLWLHHSRRHLGWLMGHAE